MQKIMIVEDDEDILFIVALLLKKNRFSVIQVSDCKKAVAVALEWMPDLILFDINLGLCDGRQLCLELKTVHHFNAPVLLFSANQELVSNLDLYKADAFIQKPFEAKELVNTIRRHLGLV